MTKFRTQFLVLCVISIFFAGCYKTDDPETPSVGMLKAGTSGNCLPFVVNGIFKVDSVLTTEHYVDVHVDVVVGGTFDIKTDTVNGYSFSKKGTLGEGLNIIRLYAGGKPRLAGVNIFNVQFGLTSCSFAITVFDAGAGTALYTLGGAPGNCSVSSINGNYIVGQPMNAGNTIETTVNVTAIGTYIIAGTAVNGVTFSANGTFTNPGVQNIFLQASGTPAAAGTFNYPVSNVTTNCIFPITYTATVTNASFVLIGSPGNCTGAVVNGTYTAGAPLTATNNLVINVNVTAPGQYNITTATVNGISFSASGTFNITGQQQISLAGTGTPAASGTFNFPVTGGGNTCGITVTCN